MKLRQSKRHVPLIAIVSKRNMQAMGGHTRRQVAVTRGSVTI
jgi:hypothetical protein